MTKRLSEQEDYFGLNLLLLNALKMSVLGSHEEVSHFSDGDDQAVTEDWRGWQRHACLSFQAVEAI